MTVSIIALVLSLVAALFAGLTWRENRRMATAADRAASAADRSAEAALQSAEAAQRSVEVQELERLRATETVDVDWMVPDERPIRIVNTGTTEASKVRATFEIHGERFFAPSERVEPGGELALPTEDTLPEGEVRRRAILALSAQPELQGFLGGTVRVTWESPHGTPGTWTGELPRDPRSSIF